MILAQVDALLLAEFVSDPVNKRTVFAPSHGHTGITVGGTGDRLGHALHRTLDLGVIIFTPYQSFHFRHGFSPQKVFVVVLGMVASIEGMLHCISQP